MKLIVQIPCYNEESTLPKVISEIPRIIDGIDKVEILIINDGSYDRTVEVAKESGVDYIVDNPRNIGLAASFSKGLEACLYLDADIIVNTDGDNQYKGAEIKNMVKELLDRNADIVIGCRDIKSHSEFSIFKKLFQKLGSIVVNIVGGLNIPDVTSGFRAYSRIASMKTIVFNNFSYTVETLIQASSQGMKIFWVPINVNRKTRESRLYKSNIHYIFRQTQIILKSFLFYRPMPFFFTCAFFLLILALIFGIRFVYFLSYVEESQQVFKMGSGILFQFSIVISALCFLGGFLCMVLSGLRSLLENLRYNYIKQVLDSKIKQPHLEAHLWRSRNRKDKNN